MAGGGIIKIELNDTDRRFREKVNENFMRTSTTARIDGNQNRVIMDSDAIRDLVANVGDRVTHTEFNAAMAEAMNQVNQRPTFAQILGGQGISVTRVGNTLLIAADCPIPVNGIHLTTQAGNPSATWTGTTWAAYPVPWPTPLPTPTPFAWRRLT